MYDLIVIGGGAAGFFAAIAAQSARRGAKVALLEKAAIVLSKVRISGGGRCNVTHACFDPIKLSQNYPRGGKELIGPFHRFGPQNTIEWFTSRGVELKTESDGRIFPISNSSETIIKCLLLEMQKKGVELLLRQKIQHISKIDNGFELELKEGSPLRCKNLLLATGSSREGYAWAESLGHQIACPVPSLFTFNVPTSALKELSGIALEDVWLKIKETPFSQRGTLLLTHFGFSGPVALKLSAWAARTLFEKNYRVSLLINWLPQFSQEEILKKLLQLKANSPQKSLLSENLFKFPKNLWKAFLDLLGSSFQKKMGEIPAKDLQLLAEKIHADSYAVEGKTTNKEEFVTCGGVALKEVDFKSMQSKICPRLYFAGEILDIDGVTGGFNFQNAWTTGFIAGNSCLSTPK